MSLLMERMQKFCKVNQTIRSDGQGGYLSTWEDDSETFLGAMVLPTERGTNEGSAEGRHIEYTLTVSRETNLDFHQVISLQEGQADNVYFRITSRSDAAETPKSATIDMRQYKAEAFVLPD